MIKKSLRPLFILLLVCFASSHQATPDWADINNFFNDNTTTVGFLLAGFFAALRCVRSCRRWRTRHNTMGARHEELQTFNGTLLLSQIAQTITIALNKKNDEIGRESKDIVTPSKEWPVFFGLEATNNLARSLKPQQRRRTVASPTSTISPREDIRGIVLVGASFGLPVIAHHTETTDVSSENLHIIGKYCIQHKIPLLIVYLEQEEHVDLLPTFKLSFFRILHRDSDDRGASSKAFEYNSLPKDLLQNIQATLQREADYFSEAKQADPSYPQSIPTEEALHDFIRRLRNYEELEA